jgi:hypothetical protein
MLGSEPQARETMIKNAMQMIPDALDRVLFMMHSSLTW